MLTEREANAVHCMRNLIKQRKGGRVNFIAGEIAEQTQAVVLAALRVFPEGFDDPVTFDALIALGGRGTVPEVLDSGVMVRWVFFAARYDELYDSRDALCFNFGTIIGGTEKATCLRMLLEGGSQKIPVPKNMGAAKLLLNALGLVTD